MRKPTHAVIIFAAIWASFFVGKWYAHHGDRNVPSSEAREVLHYSCPMHPQYVTDKPGDCPSCGMRLTPVYKEDKSPPIRSGLITISPQKQQIIGVDVKPVENWSGTRIIRTTGRVAPDENRLYRLNSSTELWVRKLYPPATGSTVRKDEPLLDFYSTNFLSAAAAFVYALNTRDRQITAQMTDTNQTQAVSYQVRQAIEGLQNLGVSDVDIKEMEKTRKARDLITLRSPADGVVLSRTATMGQWVGSSVELYQIADLSQVWILADLFENEALNVQPGMSAQVSLPHQNLTFTARVSDIPPLFEPDTRTMKVRLEAENPKRILWPGTFVDVEFPVKIAPTLVVPAESLLDSGLRQIVFVDHGNGIFEPREVKTGWRYSDKVEILRGLMEGERIVVSGNFLIDSESRLRAAAIGARENSVEDPVCGMQIDPVKAGDKRSNYAGTTYYFCSDLCKQKFDQNPGQYAHKHEPSTVTASAAASQLGKAAGAQAAGRDPVCGMEVSVAEAKAAGRMSSYQGRTYYFCTDKCKHDFDRNPGKYLTEAP